MSTYRDNRFVVTSRPAGYSGVALTGFTQLDVCDFTDEDVEAFARYWCLAVELAVRGIEREISEAVARRKAEREAWELVVAIRANDRVRRLTINPLLLTIVAMVHRYRATLPNRRVELYDECTEVLLGYWDEAKGIAGQLDWARKRRVLEPLAYCMHQQGLREAERAQVEQVIAQALPTVGEKEASAGEFLKNVRERSGLLMERGLGIYGFSHLTFQEYLTASYLIDRGEEGRGELLKHLHDPWWLEATLLYAGMRDTTPLIKAILAQRDDLFKNNLFLAARCLVDVLNIDPHVEDEVLSQLMGEFRAGEFEGLRDRAREALIDLGKIPSAPKVVEVLLGLLGDEEADVRRRAAHALGKLEQAEPSVVEALLGLLGDEDASVRGSAADALSRLGRAEPGMVEALLGLLGDEGASVRGSAADALGRLGRAEPGVVEALLGLLGDEGASVRESAADALGRLRRFRQAEPEVIKALLRQLGDGDASVRESAADALGKLGWAEPEVIKALLRRLGDEEAPVRGSAAFTLGVLGQAEPEVVKALLGLLGDEDASVRGRAAVALGLLGRAEPEVVEALLGLLGDEDASVRGNAALALGLLGPAESGLVETLLRRLSDEEASVRESAASALSWLEEVEAGVVEALLCRLSDEEASVRGSAADALGQLGQLWQLGQVEPGVIEILIGMLNDEEAEVRESAADALGLLEQAGPGVVEALLHGLDDEEAKVRGSAAHALTLIMGPPGQGIQRMSAQEIPMLMKYLGDERKVEYPRIGIPGKVKDVAWQLLQQYSQETGERIYWNDREEGR